MYYNINSFKLRWFITICLLSILAVGTMQGAKTYKLTAVTSVSASNKYVFVQDSRVMTTTGSDNLNTTTTYSTSKLTGSENYVYQLVSATGGYKLKNCSTNTYLRNGSSSKLSLSTENQTNNVWSFSFSNGVANITCVATSRYLGFSNSDHTYYRAYTGEVGSVGYGKSISVYLLEEEASCADPAAPSNSSIIS